MQTVFYIFLAVLFIASMGVPKFLRNHVGNKLTEYLLKGEYDKFDELINKFYTKFVIDPFNIYHLKLSCAFLKSDDKEVERMMKEFSKVKLSFEQKRNVYHDLFYYFVGNDNAPKARRCMKELLGMDGLPEEFKEEIKKHYDINFEKAYKWLEEDVRNFDSLSKEEKEKQAYIIFTMYNNKGEHEKADQFMKAYLDSIRDTIPVNEN